MTKKSKNKTNLWIGAIAGFFLGICGNLVASWIQQDVLSDSFTPLRIGLIVVCSIIGIFVVTVSDFGKKSSRTKEKPNPEGKKNFYSNIRMIWSRLRTRGKDIQMEDISAIGSDIDIDTK